MSNENFSVIFKHRAFGVRYSRMIEDNSTAKCSFSSPPKVIMKTIELMKNSPLDGVYFLLGNLQIIDSMT